MRTLEAIRNIPDGDEYIILDAALAGTLMGAIGSALSIVNMINKAVFDLVEAYGPPNSGQPYDEVIAPVIMASMLLGSVGDQLHTVGHRLVSCEPFTIDHAELDADIAAIGQLNRLI